MNKMSRFEDSILRYLRNKKTEYAIMINGDWGIGKTYFIKNYLIPKLKVNKKCIYISVNGIDSLSKMKRLILLKLINKKEDGKETRSIINEIIDFSGDFEFNGLKSKKIIDGFFDIMGYKKIKELNFSKICLIIDDFERLSKSIPLVDLLGFLNDSYLTEGLKVILVGSEDKIQNKEDKYENIKEKYIRYSIKFDPELNEQLSGILEKNNLNIDDDLNRLHRTYMGKIVETFKVVDHNNLRTYETFLEVFKTLQVKIKELNVEKYIIERIYFIALSLTIEYKKGNIKEGDEKVKDVFRYINRDLKQYTDNEYAMYIKDKYCTILEIDIQLFESIFNLIVSSCWDPELFEKEVRGAFPLKYGFKMSWEEKDVLLENLLNYYKSELDELEDNLKKILNYIENGEYVFYRYPYLLTLILTILNEEYSNNIVKIEKVEKIFLNGLEKSIKNYIKDDMVEFETSINHLYNEEYKNNEIVNNMIGIIKSKRKNFEIINDAKIISDFMKKINFQDDETSRQEIISIDRKSLFKRIVKTNNLKKLKELNNNGIHWLEVFFREHERYYIPGDIYDENKYLKIIVEEIDKLILDESFDQMRRSRFKDLKNNIMVCLKMDNEKNT